MDSPCIKQTVCKLLKIFQYGKYLVAYVLKNSQQHQQIQQHTLQAWKFSFFLVIVGQICEKIVHFMIKA